MVSTLTANDIYTDVVDPNNKVNPKKVGSLWVNSSTGNIWVCSSNTLNNNKWIKVDDDLKNKVDDLKNWVQETIVKLTSNSLLLSDYKGNILNTNLYQLIVNSGYGSRIPNDENGNRYGKWNQFSSAKFKTPDIPYWIKHDGSFLYYHGELGRGGKMWYGLVLQELPDGEHGSPVTRSSFSSNMILPNRWYLLTQDTDYSQYPNSSIVRNFKKTKFIV